VKKALENKEPFVPVILKYLDEEEENEVLSTLDNIGLLAQRNEAALQSLLESHKEKLKEVRTSNDQKLAQLNKDLTEYIAAGPSVLLPQAKTKIRKPREEPEVTDRRDEEQETEDVDESYDPVFNESTIETVINDDVFFQGGTFLGIPYLEKTDLAPADSAPSVTYLRDGYSEDKYYCLSSGPFEETIGTLGFYTEDFRFEDAYRDGATFAEYLQQLDPVAVLTPDFSTYSDWPTILRMYSLYRSRWCGRFWGSLGFKIIPSIQYLGSDTLTNEYALSTLPDQIPILSIQCRKSDTEGIISFVKLITAIIKPEIFLLYGGLEKQKYIHGYLPYQKKIEYRYLGQYNEQRRKLLRKKK
jgi:hypothetical protein